MEVREKGKREKETTQKKRITPIKKRVKEEDFELKGEDIGNSSGSDDGNEAFLEELLASPSKPKGPPPPRKRDAIDKLPVMKLFKHHLTTFEGGSRKESAATDHMQRIGQLLYQVDENPRSVSLLWQDASINLIRRTVFKGNDMSDKPKAPQTLTAFVVSMRLFYKFVNARQEAIKRLIPLNDEDVGKVTSALTRVETWPSSWSTAAHARIAKLRKRDEKERLQTNDYASILNSSLAASIEKEFGDVKREKKIVDVATFSRMRDYLLIRIMLASAQRCGAAANLTIEEFKNGEWATKFQGPMYVTSTLRHKTEASGSANLFWDSKVKEMADIYLNFLRPFFANDHSMLPAVPGVPSTAAFFITSTGSTLSASRVSRCIMRIGKRLHPSLEGNLKGSRIRKAVISLDRENISSSTTTKSMLARQMTHSTATADQYYAVNSKLVEKGKVAEYIECLTLPQAITKKKSLPKKIRALEEESSESEIIEEGDGSSMRERIEESVNANEEIEDKGEELGQQHVEEEESEDVEKEDVDREINENKTNQEKDESTRPNNVEKENDNVRAEVEEPAEGKEEPNLEEKEQSKEELPQRRSKEDGLSVEQKKELIRIFGAKHLGKGVVPQRHIVLFRAARNPTLKALNVDDAMNYLKRKCTSDLPGRAKVMSWVSSQGKSINQIETSSTASFPGRRFTEYQGEIIHSATASLPDSAKMKDILEKIKNDKTCSEYGIMDMFTRQQLRDKFVNIRKNLRKISF